MCCQKAASLYRAHFCGLGTSLHRHYGAWARWLVNRDSAFLTLLGSALAEAPPVLCRTTCCNAFATPRDLVADSPVLQYTAAVTVCGLSAKLDDDAQDERGWRRHAARVGSRALDRPIGDALGLLHAMRFPVQDVRGWMAGQADIEHSSASLHECARPTCAAYGEIVGHLAQVSGAPGAKPLLHQLGESLGFLIYAQDAWEDWARDKKRGQFNPLHAFPDLVGRRAALLPKLEQALASLRCAFDALPLRRHRDLLQTVLIAGAEARVVQVAGDTKKGTKHVQSPIEGTRRKRSCWDKCDGCHCGDCSDCCDCCRPGWTRGGSSMIDCNPCDGDGCGCCGCDC
ncbi:DUF5685 family protein [Prosthecobacter vanneervenii]|uniref:Uncharacterized protein n=1 Tax=Prosthecobacter vanneervenii TaxID=48466 RepID=A0A7W7YAX0_9BACT|nr:DUF5685 family protein [Prosthecobacter vanneervenii]MBB5032725.1 hypothetical protein [Prosthecobacter vanneervenii]